MYSKAAATPSLACAMASTSVKSLSVCFAIKFSISLLTNLHRPFESFLLLSAFPHVSFPAVPATKPAVEEVVALLAGNLEADIARGFSRNDGLLTFAADDDGSEFHSSPPQFCLLFPIRQLVE